VDNSFYNRHY